MPKKEVKCLAVTQKFFVGFFISERGQTMRTEKQGQIRQLRNK
ncbi:unnamed protein product [marine sediment metagenome]|uniref:Uncharacterized protein n=1 Tax=marine sediment metagenome TaxID=412755 RepID=X1DCW2_9ZZZZ